MSDEVDQEAPAPVETDEQRWAREDAMLREKHAQLEARRLAQQQVAPLDVGAIMAKAEATRLQAAPRINARREAYEAERPKRVEAAQRGLTSWLLRVGVPRRYRELEYRIDGVPEELRWWASGFPGSADGSALLAGTVGSGKTTAAAWLLREFYLRSIPDDPESYWAGPPARMIDCSDLYDLLFEKQRAELMKLRKVPLLVIDDMGVAYEHDWPLAMIDRLINARWSDMLPTVATTNLVPSREIAKANGRPEADTLEGRFPRAYSRLLDDHGPGLVLMVGRDQRRGPTPLTRVK